MDKLKQWTALTVVGCMAIMAAGWFLLISPKRGEAADLREQTVSQESANALLRNKLDVLRAQAKDLPKKQADLARVAAKIPDNPALPSLIRALTAAGTSAGVQLVSVTPGPPAPYAAPVAAAEAPLAPGAPAAPATPPAPAAPPAPGAPAPPASGVGTLSEITLAINVVGGYFEVEQFLANLENLPRALRVTNVNLAPGSSPTAGDNAPTSSDDGRSLVATINGSVFLANGRQAAAPALVPTAVAPPK